MIEQEGKNFKGVNFASVAVNTFLGGGNFINNSVWESTSSFLIYLIIV